MIINKKYKRDEIICEEPLRIVSMKLGISLVDKEGKKSKTIFKRLVFKNNCSIIKCNFE